MDTEALRAALDPWMREPTWHTEMPEDEARFNLAVATACKSVEWTLDAAVVEEVMLDLSRRYHPGLDTLMVIRAIDGFAQRAEALSLFVAHTRGI